VSRLPQRIAKQKGNGKVGRGCEDFERVREVHKFHRDFTKNWRLVGLVIGTEWHSGKNMEEKPDCKGFIHVARKTLKRIGQKLVPLIISKRIVSPDIIHRMSKKGWISRLKRPIFICNGSKCGHNSGRGAA
jgi:hypothetical protein